ncbi:MAG: hypothetical protein WCK10_02205 [Candidatus Staskawiczbacteria bacterium]
MKKPDEYKKEIMGDCPLCGCGGKIVKEITHKFFTEPPLYCEKCGTIFKFATFKNGKASKK